MPNDISIFNISAKDIMLLFLNFSRQIVFLYFGIIFLIYPSFGQVLDQLDSIKISQIAQQNARFPGGESAFYQYLNENCSFSFDDIGEAIVTKIYVKFTVLENGKLTEIQIVRGINEKIDKMITAVFKNMPYWEPAYSDGKLIVQQLIYPIKIEIK